jgi:hypothetical protein
MSCVIYVLYVYTVIKYRMNGVEGSVLGLFLKVINMERLGKTVKKPG